MGSSVFGIGVHSGATTPVSCGIVRHVVWCGVGCGVMWGVVWGYRLWCGVGVWCGVWHSGVVWGMGCLDNYFLGLYTCGDYCVGEHKGISVHMIVICKYCN